MSLCSPTPNTLLGGLVENPQPGTEAVLNPVRQVPGDILVASTLVHMDQRVPVRLANFSNEVVRLRAGVLVGDLVEAMPSQETPRQESRREVARVTMQEASVGPDMALTRLPVHLHELFARAAEDLGDSEADRLVEVLSRYADVFAQHDLDLGCFPAVKHRINTGDARPIRQPPRRTPLGFEGEEEGHLQQMLDAGIVEPSQSEWASPVVLVRKKDGGGRWCVDYRQLNAVTEKDAYPLPKIEECLDTLSGATLFSMLDLQSGYWQVEMAPEDRDKTAFVTKEVRIRVSRPQPASGRETVSRTIHVNSQQSHPYRRPEAGTCQPMPSRGVENLEAPVTERVRPLNHGDRPELCPVCQRYVPFLRRHANQFHLPWYVDAATACGYCRRQSGVHCVFRHHVEAGAAAGCGRISRLQWVSHMRGQLFEMLQDYLGEDSEAGIVAYVRRHRLMLGGPPALRPEKGSYSGPSLAFGPHDLWAACPPGPEGPCPLEGGAAADRRCELWGSHSPPSAPRAGDSDSHISGDVATLRGAPGNRPPGAATAGAA